MGAEAVASVEKGGKWNESGRRDAVCGVGALDCDFSFGSRRRSRDGDPGAGADGSQYVGVAGRNGGDSVGDSTRRARDLFCASLLDGRLGVDERRAFIDGSEAGGKGESGGLAGLDSRERKTAFGLGVAIDENFAGGGNWIQFGVDWRLVRSAVLHGRGFLLGIELVAIWG